MKNLDISISDNILTIRVDLTQEHGDSKKGRSTVISSSGGNLRLCGPDGNYREEILNMSVCRRKPRGSKRSFFS